MEGATGCLRAARFARNFFEKSFESLPRMIKSSTRLGVGQFFFRNSGAGGCGRALQMFRVCVFPGASRPCARFARDEKIKTFFLRLFFKTFFKDFFVGESRWKVRQDLVGVPKGGALRAR